LNRYEFNDTLVHNPYSYLPVNGGNEEASALFLHYLLHEGRQTIANYTINGAPAFYI
jgi:ABC-type tungstate transport system permease subunit